MTVTLTSDDADALGRRTVVGHHDLHTNELFSDASIAEILENHPPAQLVALTMGTDPTKSSENERVRHTGVSGNDLLSAVASGRLWLNVTGIDQVDLRFRSVVDALYADVGDLYPAVRGIETHATLLVSSPNAIVYFHVDAPSSYLWHIRGRKRVWVYPAQDPRVLSKVLLEDVFAGVRQEYVPYEPGFDDLAEAFDLEPGDVAMWPQNAPHRVTNYGSLNISLVTDHFTADGRARARVYKANRFFRTRFHVPPNRLSTASSGFTSVAKAAIHKAGARAHLEPPATSKAHRSPTRFIDPIGPGLLSPIPNADPAALES